MATELIDWRELATRFEAEQADLRSLCADRGPQTGELWPYNEYYGIAATLKRYAGVPDARQIKAVIPHGVYFNDDYLAPAEKAASVPAALVFPRYREHLYLGQGKKVVLPSAAPFVYAASMVAEPPSRRGTLFYPAHSIPGITKKADFAAIADSLLDWPEHMKPVDIMVYYRDYQLGHHQAFADRGFRVLSAGHIHDHDFLLRQAYLLKQHEYVASNAVGSHVFYATDAGCTVQLTEHPYSVVGDDESIRDNAPRLSAGRLRQKEEIRQAFLAGPAALSEHQELTDYYLGRRYIMRADELAELFDWLDRLDRYGPRLLVLNDDSFEFIKPEAMPFCPFRLQRAPGQAVAEVERVLRAGLAGAIRLLRIVLPCLRNVRRPGRRG